MTILMRSDIDIYKSISRALEAWARWRYENSGADIGFPHQAPFRRLIAMPDENNLNPPPMPDDVAISVDRAVGILKLKSFPVKGDFRWIAVVECYLAGQKDKQIGYKHKISSATARNARIAGENFIEGCLLTDTNLNENYGLHTG